MKSLDDLGDDISALFASILNRINENRSKNNKIIIPDREKEAAIEDYVKAYPNDYIVWGDN